MHRATVLIVDDDENVCLGLRHTLRAPEYRVLLADGPVSALRQLQTEPVDVVVSDHLMPGVTGLEFLKMVRDRYPDTIRIMLTGHADTETAVKAINEGEIYRFLIKPCQPTELKVTIYLACERLELERQNRRLLAVVRTNPELMKRIEEEEERHRLRRRGEAAGS
jgi:DNA-binding NtrC family response regulator